MDPWDIIGWVILGTASLLVLYVLTTVLTGTLWGLYKGASILRRHLKTRDIEPKIGQIWVQDEDDLLIKHVFDNGNVSIKAGSSSWADTPQEWKTRVRNRKLYLKEKINDI